MDEDINRPAPGELWRVQRLINTADLEDETDALSDPDALGAWLRAHGLCGDEAFSSADLARIVAFREALRSVLLAHHGGVVDAAALAALDGLGSDAAVVVGFAPDGSPRLSPLARGAGGVLARLLAIIARADAEGTWARLKACPADDCRWAFYDFSRNHSRTWCSMSVCGNRAKARTYRRRGGGTPV